MIGQRHAFLGQGAQSVGEAVRLSPPAPFAFEPFGQGHADGAGQRFAGQRGDSAGEAIGFFVLARASERYGVLS